MKAIDTTDGQRECRSCRKRKPLAEFHVDRGTKCGRGSNCKPCAVAKACRWRTDNIDKFRASARIREKQKRARQREMVLTAYGRACACCGETEPVFLALDHRYNDGAAHRRSLSKSRTSTSLVYGDVIRRGFPTEFQLLCHNCNMAKEILGECPHTARRKESAA